MNTAETLTDIVHWLEEELETARRQLRELRLSEDGQNPAEAGPGEEIATSGIPEPGERQENASPVILRGNSRKLSKDRYERKLNSLMLAVSLSTEIERLITEGRVPWNVALVALGVCVDQFEDKLAEESLSWAENFTPAYDNHWGRMDDDPDPAA